MRFDGLDVAVHGRHHPHAVLPLQRGADRPQRERRPRRLPGPPPGDPGLLRQQGLLQPLVPRPRAARRHRHRGELGRRALEGSPRRLRAAADHLQRQRQDARRDRGRPAAAHRGHRRGLGVRAAARRRRGRRPRRRRPGSPSAWTSTWPRRRTRACAPAPGAKAGIDASEAIGAFGLAAQLPAVRLVGMHYHIGSQITHVEPFLEALEERPGAARARGGRRTTSASSTSTSAAGWPSPTTTAATTSPTPTSRRRTPWRATRRAIAEAFHAARPELQLYLEPGRAIAGNTAVLVTRVEAEKTKLVEAAPGRIQREDWLMVDAGFNTILEHSSYHWYFRAVVANRCSKPPVRPFRLGGPLCDGGDVYTGDPGLGLPLPADRQRGRRRDRLSRRRRLLARVHERLQRPRPGGRLHGHRGRPAADRRPGGPWRTSWPASTSSPEHEADAARRRARRSQTQTEGGASALGRSRGVTRPEASRCT